MAMKDDFGFDFCTVLVLIVLGISLVVSQPAWSFDLGCKIMK